MVWLVAHMWIALGLAAVFGLLFGWAFRGLRLKGMARDALVARDVAVTELDQAKLEIDQLYAAQNKLANNAGAAGDTALQAELEAREKRLRSLTEELSGAQNELEELKAKAADAVSGDGTSIVGASAVAGAAVAAPRLDAGLNPANAAAEWRNRYLSSRVRTLESKLEDGAIAAEPEIDVMAIEAERDAAEARAQAALAEAEAARSEMDGLRTGFELDKETAIAAALAASAAAAATAVLSDEPDKPDAPEEDDSVRVNAEKMAWQNSYLRQRADYLGAYPPKARPVPIEAAPTEIEEDVQLETEEDAGSGGAQAASADAGEIEQELARLRWRNRYLEGRLAYIDGDAPKSDAEIAAEASPEPVEDNAKHTLGLAGAALATGTAAVVAEDADEDGDVVEAETEAVSMVEGLAEPEAEPVDTVVDVVDEPVPFAPQKTAPPADVFLATMESDGALVKPQMVETPDDGGDDLTRIDGLDTGTAQILNELGIWHYRQLADWTPENGAWVNHHLGRDGRVEDERWIAQADALLTVAEDVGQA